MSKVPEDKAKALEEAVELIEENVEDLHGAYLKDLEVVVEEEVERRDVMAETELSRETRIGDLTERRRIASDMIENGMEYSAGPDYPWSYGVLEVYRGSSKGEPYLMIRDIDGVSQSMVHLGKLRNAEEDPVKALQEKLDEIDAKVHEQL